MFRIVEVEARPPTWERLVTAWLYGYTSPNTQRAYRSDAMAWTKFCVAGRVEPLAAIRAHIDIWVQTMTAERTRPATIRRRIASISSLYDYALDHDIVRSNPCSRVRRPKAPATSSTAWLTSAELAAFLDAARRLGPREHVAARLLAVNGLRSAEVRSIRVEEIGSHGGYTTLLVHGKGGNEQRVPVPQGTADAIDDLLDACDDRKTGWLLDGGPLSGWAAYLGDRTPLVIGPASDWHPVPIEDRSMYAEMSMSHAQLRRTVARIAKAARLRQTFGPHALRHSAITAALDAGVEHRHVQTFARHADPRTTVRYDRTRLDFASHASLVLDRVLAAA